MAWELLSGLILPFQFFNQYLCRDVSFKYEIDYLLLCLFIFGSFLCIFKLISIFHSFLLNIKIFYNIYKCVICEYVR